MRVKIAHWLRWLANWIDLDFSFLRIRASVLVKAAEEEVPDPGRGELRRHFVYARLIKEFPEVSRRRIGLMIEQVL